MSARYIAPKYAGTAFNCVLCGAFAAQRWAHLSTGDFGTSRLSLSVPRFSDNLPSSYAVCRCGHCGGLSLWKDYYLIHPDTGSVEMPNDDLPDEVKKDYLEAAGIVVKSPRGAAALLRLAIQKLCDELVQEKGDLNFKIGKLVEGGLNKKIRQALDVVRVVGNNSVHPGQIDLKDSPDTAHQLFALVNMIAQQMITEPAQVDAMFEALPEEAKKAVEKRDTK